MNQKWIAVALVVLSFAAVLSAFLAIGVPAALSDQPELQIAAWGVAVNFIAALGAIAAALGAFATYRSERRTEFVQQRVAPAISTLRRAKSVTANLVEEKILDSAAGNAGIREFWQLYYGDLVGVENTKVEAGMFRFGRALRAAQAGSRDQEGMRAESLALSREIEDQIRELEAELAQVDL